MKRLIALSVMIFFAHLVAQAWATPSVLVSPDTVSVGEYFYLDICDIGGRYVGLEITYPDGSEVNSVLSMSGQCENIPDMPVLADQVGIYTFEIYQRKSVAPYSYGRLLASATGTAI